ncbi:sorbitol dehydrogenase-like [Drosophila nasuta]|uniref:sorbitol dehydrogenase-like n=1 Tax=Drosophila nasuta TaxID=42062 RepID=UPI00295EE451|nr:sorbitol dehydrogenase-like [Drosophila nasuta]
MSSLPSRLLRSYNDLWRISPSHIMRNFYGRENGTGLDNIIKKQENCFAKRDQGTQINMIRSMSVWQRNYFNSRCKSDKCKQDNLTAVLHGIEDLRLEQRPIPTISEDEVLIAMDCVGICGSDIHYWVNGRIGHFVLTKPMIIGHESSGVITKVGSRVRNLVVGDRVAMEPGIPCGNCELCKIGKYNLCPDMVFCATPPYDGNLTRYYKQAAHFCFKLPDHVTMEEGALLEPLSVGVHACRRADVGLGSKVLILGAGTIGLVSLIAAQSMGATEIMITDLLQDRLTIAEELGATHTLLLKRDDSLEEILECVRQTMNGEPDKSIDCCGAESSTRLAIMATRSGGVVVVVGMGAEEMKLPLLNALIREVDIRGVFRYCNDYAGALALVASGQANVKRLVTHHFDITETEKAFETSRCGLGGPIKVMIHVQPRDTNNPVKF